MARIVIVGGGVAGLSAGIYAQMSGHSAVICEKHTRAGGNLTGWQRGNYHIDNCIHWLTGTNPKTETYKMWCELGALGEGIKVYQGESLYTCTRDGQEISLYCDIEKTRKAMYAISPEDKEEIDGFIGTVKMLMEFMGISDERHVTIKEKAKLMTYMPLFAKYYFLSTGGLAERFKHPLLRDFICGVMGDDFGSIALLTVFAIFCGKNGGIPQGGSVAMADRMTNRYLELGGQLLLKSDVVKIEKKGKIAGKVKLSNGQSLEADYIILCTDPAVAFKRLLCMPMPTPLKKQYENRRMMRFSSIQCAFSCDCDQIPFKGDCIFEIPKEEQRILRAKYLILREFLHEPSFAPEGKNVIQGLIFCDERECARWIVLSKNKRIYNARKESFAKMVKKLTEQRFTCLANRLEIIDVWTPATYKRFTESEIGSYMSFILPSRMLPRKISSRTVGLENVFLATQWQQAPGGLPTAANRGREVIKLINQKEADRAQLEREGKGAFARRNVSL